MKSLLKQLEHSCSFKQRLVAQINANNTDCAEVNACVNTQLGLPNAGSLTNFNQASVNAIVAYFSQTGVQAPTAAEVCAYLSSLPQNTTIDSTTKLVLGSCEYGTVGDLVTYLSSVISIDDQTITSSANTMSLTNGGTAPIINSNTLANDGVNTITSTVNGVADSDVIINSISSSTDVNGDLIITVNGVASAPIDINPDCADVVACVEAAPILNLNDVNTDNISTTGNLVIPASQLANTTSGNTSSVTVGNQTATAPIINSNVIDTVGNVITSTVNGVSDTAPIINTVVNSVDGNGDLITTVNGVASSPLDLGAVLDIDDQQISTSGNTITLTNGGTAPIVNSISSSTDVNGDLIVTVNGVASAPLDINPDCADVVACVEAAPTLTLNNVITDDLTVTGDLVLPASEVALSTSGNTATLTVGNQTLTAPIVNSNVLSSTGLTLTSTVNGVADSEDLTLATEALILLNTDSVTNTVAGHLIATHTAVDNTSVNINETVTSTTAVGTGIQTTNEDGSTNLITFPIINAGTPTAAMEVRVDGNLVTTIPLVQYDVQIDNAGSDFNLVDDQLTFLETNGDSATINFSKYNISAVLVAGGIGIYQNGNLITTIPTTASGIAIVDAGNYYTSTDVEGALQELGGLVAGGAFTVTDTTTVDLTKTGNDIQAAVIIDPATDNLIQVTANGLFADADAIAHNYNNTTSGLTATNVQDAIDELDAILDNTCSGNAISVSNPVLTSDTLTTNTTVPATVVATPDPTNAVNSFVKAVAVKNGCKEEQYVPAQRNVIRTSAALVSVVNANPLVPNVVNNSGYDEYHSTITYTYTIPSTGNWVYDFNSFGYPEIVFPNIDGKLYSRINGQNSTTLATGYGSQTNKLAFELSGAFKSGVVASGTTVTLEHKYVRVVTTGIAPVMTNGQLNFSFAGDNIITLYPVN